MWRLVHGFGDGLILLITYTTIARLFHVDRIGGNAGLISFATTLGVLAGSLIYGPVALPTVTRCRLSSPALPPSPLSRWPMWVEEGDCVQLSVISNLGSGVRGQRKR